MTLFFLKSSICLVVLYGLYWGLLKRSTFYQLNRGLLMMIVLAVCLLPWIEVPTGKLLNTPATEFPLQNGINGIAKALEPALSVAPESGHLPGKQILTEEAAGISTWVVLKLIYVLGLCFFLTRTGSELWNIWRLIRTGQMENAEGHHVVWVNRSIPPLAFFNRIVLNADEHDEGRLEHILRHELVHVKQHHTVDILLLECFTAVFWFHPLAWKLKKAVKLNLEFIADREVLAKGGDRKSYQLDLLRLSMPHHQLQTVNHFNYSHLKTRIIMMNGKRSSRLSLWKYFTFMPVLAFLLIAFQPAHAQNKDDQAAAVGLNLEPGQNIYMKISADLEKHEVDRILARLEETGVDLTGTEFDYNAAGKITRARLQVVVGDYTGSVQTSNDGGPIKEPVIFYYSRKADKVGISVGTPKTLSREEQKIFSKFTGILIGQFDAD